MHGFARVQRWKALLSKLDGAANRREALCAAEGSEHHRAAEAPSPALDEHGHRRRARTT